MFSTKMLPPSHLEPSRWFNFKYEAGKWLRARLFPPTRRKEYNWDTMFEDWEEDDRIARRDYPVRWFLEKAWNFISKWPKIENAFYWLRTHTYNRYHILDLRKAEPENPDGYRWGYLDQCTKIDLAMFLVLRDYWENGNPYGGPLTDPLTWNPDLTEEEKKQILAEVTEGDQVWQYQECKALMEWWTKGRFEEETEKNKLWQTYRADKTNDAACDIWLAAEQALEKRKVEMLVRLAKLSPYLWS